ncbi:hypothetical protein Clopa_1000 [Clostridium pasteurianum BC1]|uniref:Uncharacterized protein n=1 Tax=Clostridium pasteurianum BC1 TaxID=86416 RepID=R4K2T5_CLOPA|nr:hypothetical protein Clopa_1000 [Clostridium pasteurianum BC1]
MKRKKFILFLTMIIIISLSNCILMNKEVSM